VGDFGLQARRLAAAPIARSTARPASGFFIGARYRTRAVETPLPRG